MTKHAPEAVRTRLIEVSLERLSHSGVQGFTLESVAREAGVSKGALLHHFPSKDALVSAILDHLFTSYETLVNTYYAQEADSPGRWARAYIRATFADSMIPLEVASLLLSSMYENQDLLEAVKADDAAWRERLRSDGLPPARAAIIQGATDSMWQARILGFYSDPVELADMLAELLKLAGGDL